MADEKDRFGQKISDVERARENQWARQHDEELLEKMRHKAQASIVCPQCGKGLIEHKHREIHYLACPDHHGAWLGPQAMAAFINS